MKSILYILSFIFLTSCSSLETYEYQIYSYDQNKSIDTRLIIDVIDSPLNDSITINIQSFPKYLNNVNSYEMLFDMKFREDYSSNSNICIGPTWNEYGPGEFSIQLQKENDFKNKIIGIYSQNNEDECVNHFYYLRYLIINLDDGNKIYTGVATDYAEDYPDAPHYWVLDKNNIIDKNGSTNIEKYSLYFELSK